MTKHGSGIIEIGDGEDEGHCIRAHLRQPVFKLGAGVFRKVFDIKVKFLLQPLVARNEFTLGVFGSLLLIRRRKKTCQRGVEFGWRIEFAGKA